MIEVLKGIRVVDLPIPCVSASDSYILNRDEGIALVDVDWDENALKKISEIRAMGKTQSALTQTLKRYSALTNSLKHRLIN